MATLKQKILAETRTRELLKENGLPEPDGVEYGHTCIRLFFDEPKVALVVDIDEIDDDVAEATFEVECGEADEEPEPEFGYLAWREELGPDEGGPPLN